MTDLASLREQIDALDSRIIDLLAERIALCRQVAAYKRRHEIPVRIPERIEAVTARCAALGAERGLEPDYLRRLYAIIIEETCRTEEREIAALSGAADIRSPDAAS